jgi:arginase
VRDAGDGPLQVWAPDSATPLAQNLSEVLDAIRVASLEVGAALDEGADVLVLGGNCTIALATMDALIARYPDAGLLYIDRHLDMNTPESTTDGALDWMGMAHGFDLAGAIPEFAAAFCRRPLLTPSQVCYLGVDQDDATEWERAECDRMEMRWGSNARLAALPAAEAESALRLLPSGPFAVHADVDVLNFTESPLSESTGGRNVGPSLAGLTDALEVACHDSRFRVLSIGELNPSRAAGQPQVLQRFVDMLAQVL